MIHWTWAYHIRHWEFWWEISAEYRGKIISHQCCEWGMDELIMISPAAILNDGNWMGIGWNHPQIARHSIDFMKIHRFSAW